MLEHLDDTSDIITECEHHQRHEQEHSDNLRCYHELVIRLMPAYHLIYQEQQMTAVQTRYRNKVHDPEHDGEQSKHIHEYHPVPMRREHLPYGNEAPHLLVCPGARSSHKLHIADVPHDHVPRVLHPCRNGLRQCVCTFLHPWNLQGDAYAS